MASVQTLVDADQRGWWLKLSQTSFELLFVHILRSKTSPIGVLPAACNNTSRAGQCQALCRIDLEACAGCFRHTFSLDMYL